MAKLVKIVKRTGVMKAESGIQINGPGVTLGPGGLDSEVVKNPMTGLPYIPGSSFKGKMRASLESKLGKDVNGKPCGCGYSNCIICTLFGAHLNMKSEAGTPRLLFRDMELTDEFKIVDGITEDKAATMINRNTHTAATGSLRHVERVSAGAEFNYEIVIQIYEGDSENKIIETLDSGMRLIEATGIGGGTSHGNGKVKFISKKDEVVEL